MSNRTRPDRVCKRDSRQGATAISKARSPNARNTEVAQKGLRTSADLCEATLRTIEDLCLGNVSTNVANGIFNGIGRVCKLKELEMNYAKVIGGKASNVIKLLPGS